MKRLLRDIWTSYKRLWRHEPGLGFLATFWTFMSAPFLFANGEVEYAVTTLVAGLLVWGAFTDGHRVGKREGENEEWARNKETLEYVRDNLRGLP